MKKQKIWETKGYYQKAYEGSAYLEHPGMRVLKKVASDRNKILDLGCGEGTRLNFLKPKYGFGIDISKTAIKLAKKKYPKFNYAIGDLEALPFSDDTFDLVYSAFVLEHVSKPEETLKEAVRVLKKKGKIVILAPNYGSPNRCSPPFKGSRLWKFIKGSLLDLFPVINEKRLNWPEVVPIKNKYKQDYDTVVEPYIGSLIKYLKTLGIHEDYMDTLWSEELKGAKLHQKLFKLLANNNIYPFVYWGPQILYVGTKI